MTADRDDDGNPVTTPAPTSAGINLDSSARDITGQGVISVENTNSRLRATDPPAGTADGQQSRVQFTPANNYYKNVSDNKDIAKLVSLLVTCINATKKDITTALEIFSKYNALWQRDRDEELKEFLVNEPRVSEFEAKIKFYENLELDISSQSEFISVGPLAIFTGKKRFSFSSERKKNKLLQYILHISEHLKFALNQEVRDWIVRYGQACNARYRKEMNDVSAFIEDIEKRLSRPINDLEDIRLVMIAIKDLRENEIRIDMSIAPIEESYTMLQAHGLNVAREESERSESIRLAWEKLQRHSVNRLFSNRIRSCLFVNTL